MAGKSTHQSSDLASEAGSWRKLHHIWWKENGRFVRLRANFHFEVWKWSKNYRNISWTKKGRLIPLPRSRFPFRLLRWKKKSAEHQLKRMPGRFFHTCLHVHLHVWGWRWNYQNTSWRDFHLGVWSCRREQKSRWRESGNSIFASAKDFDKLKPGSAGKAVGCRKNHKIPELKEEAFHITKKLDLISRHSTTIHTSDRPHSAR